MRTNKYQQLLRTHPLFRRKTMEGLVPGNSSQQQQQQRIITLPKKNTSDDAMPPEAIDFPSPRKAGANSNSVPVVSTEKPKPSGADTAFLASTQKITAASIAPSSLATVANKPPHNNNNIIDEINKHNNIIDKIFEHNAETNHHPAKNHSLLVDEDEFSVNELDDPEVVSPWQPKNHDPEKHSELLRGMEPASPVKPPVEHRWSIGETVEVKPAEGTLSDFARIIGLNDDGTYNLKDIFTDGFKKMVSPDRIIGGYDDLLKEYEPPSKKTKRV